jgi:hypothetical protein
MPTAPAPDHGRHGRGDIAVAGLDVGGHGDVDPRDDSGDDGREAFAPSSAPSGTPRDQATPALVVAIAFAPAAAIATADATSHAFGSKSGSPGRCRLAKAFARSFTVLGTADTLGRMRPGGLAVSGQLRRGAS